MPTSGSLVPAVMTGLLCRCRNALVSLCLPGHCSGALLVGGSSHRVGCLVSSVDKLWGQREPPLTGALKMTVWTTALDL